MRIYIETYGCSSSRNDSEIMAGLLSSYQLVDNIEKSDVIIINTCIVKERTENKLISRIRSVQEKYPEKKLIITGCMPEAEPELLRRIAPSASLVSTNKINEIGNVVENTERIEIIGKEKISKACLPKLRKNPVVNIVEICSGCSQSCSYCITKLAKGSLFCYPPEEIVKEIESAYKDGCREFWLTGQDVAAYDYNGITLPHLLKKIIEVDGNYFLRLGMMNPSSVLPILDELIDIYRNEHVFKFLHPPVQSGSDEVLERMNRDYSASAFKEIISKFKKNIPDITIWTDVIVGFPGESNDDFASSLELVRETRPDFVNVSRFGPRPKTKAAAMRQLPVQLRKDRSRVISKLVDEIALERNRKWLNWSGPALVDEYNKQKKNWIARNHAYKPIVISGKTGFGEAVNVKITRAERSLIGSLIKS